MTGGGPNGVDRGFDWCGLFGRMKEAGRGFVPLAECRQARRVTV
jgi:hypothetical protein